MKIPLKKESYWFFWKILFAMKLILFVFCFTIAQAKTPVYSQVINLLAKNESIEQVLLQINKQSKYDLVYDAKALQTASPVSLNLENASLKDALDQVFLNQPFDYELRRNTIVVKNKPVGKMRPNRLTNSTTLRQRVTGKIINEKGEPVSGVSVMVKNRPQIGTTTDGNGMYILNVEENTVLVFKYVGYLTQEIEVENKTTIDVKLVLDDDRLNEVVIVGYGTQKKASVVGAITTIEPKKLKIGNSRSMSNVLSGQLAGVIGVQRGGEPGFDNSTFWIRGISTFAGGRDPLVLVDGIERSLNDMDPEEIESFSILKDAAASAVYGVRGANGVILVNTKRGKIGKPKVSVKLEQALSSPVQLPEFIGAAEYLGVLNSIRRENGASPLYSEEQMENIRNKVDPDLYPDVNWLDAISKKYASNTRANINVSGGTSVLRYALVGSYFGETGVIETDSRQEWDSSSKLSRYNIRSNVDVNISPSTVLRLNIGGYLQDRFRAPESVSLLFDEAFNTPPHVHPIQYSTGEIPRTTQRQNPWALATQQGYERHSGSKLETLFSLDQDLSEIIPGLKAKGTFSFDRYSNNRVTRKKEPDYYNPASARNPDGSLNLNIGTYGQEFLGYTTGSDWGNKSVYIEGVLNYMRTIGKSDFESMFLYNQRHYDDGSALPFRNQGIAGRLSYSFDKRYIAEVNFGYNGSENFAEGKRFGFFPSAAIGWYVSEEPFMESLKPIVSKLKLRASYGLVGNDNLEGRRFAYITTIGTREGYSWGYNKELVRTGRLEGDYGNPNLTWETVAKTNVGFELGVWNLVELEVDYFKEQRRDIFMQRRSIPGSSGFINAPWANYGKVDNQGVDMTLTLNKQMSKDYFLSVRGVLTYAVNKIIEQDEAATINGTSRSSTNKSVGQYFGLIAEGLFNFEDFSDVASNTLNNSIPKHTFGIVRPGDIRYKDMNGDDVIDVLDRTAIGGTNNPQLTFGIGANMSYKNFDFGFFFQGMGLTDRILGGNNFIPGSAAGAMGNILTNVNDRWTVENPRQDVFWPRLSDYQNANNNQASTWWLRDMSVIRLRSIEMGYNFPSSLVKQARILSGSRFFIRGNNLLKFSKFKLWDPELGSDNGARYPIMKTVSMGLEINFK